MNNLLKIKEKINKAKRLNKAQLLATKNGEVIPYRRAVFEKRIIQAKGDLLSKYS